jgi:PAS domain S-box-containing protein
MIVVAGPGDDPDLRIEFVNEAFVRTTGYTREEVLGQSPDLLYGPLTEQNEIDRLRRAGERREAVHSELLTYRKDGESYWTEIDIVPVTVHAGEHSHFVAVGRDISERRRDQQALRDLNTALEDRVRVRTAELDRARELAEQANRAKSAFLATMSHEIRTPMNGVIGMIDVLEQTSLRSSQVDIVKTARESAYTLLSIVDDVLDFSKIEAGEFQIDSEPMSVAAVVEGVCDTLDHIAARKGVALGLFVDPRLPERVMGDATRLRQVLLNLVDNAIKFTSRGPRPGQVDVRVVQAGPSGAPDQIEISVADNGIGMDDATLARLFQPFTQADSGTTRRFGGTGLGLSISRHLVELMGGSIDVSSAAGQGSTFKALLPLLPAPALSAIESIDGSLPELQGQLCVVLGAARGAADDLTLYLEHAGARVLRARDLASAVALLERETAGICVVVIAMAGDALEAVLTACRAVGRERVHLALRFVVIEEGRRRRPRAKAEDLVCLDGESLRRTAFLRSVALASGRILVAEKEDTAFGVETVPLPDLDAGVPGKSILVAEDNEINQKVLRRQLALLGINADIVANGREALERWRAIDYSLLITDLHMPQMDGYELTAAIRAAEAGQRRIPIVAVTANAVKGEARRCHEVGMDDYMTKPVQLSALKALLMRWLTPADVAPDRLEPNESVVAPSDGHAQSGSMAADLTVLADLVGEDADQIAEVLNLFQTTSEQLREQIRGGISSGRLKVVADAAHQLKSNARSIGASAFGDTCAAIEQMADDGNADGVRDGFALFEAELAVLSRYLESVDPSAGYGGNGRRQ